MEKKLMAFELAIKNNNETQANKIKEEIITEFEKLLSFKSSTEYTVDSITLESIIDNQEGEQIVTFQETKDERNYLVEKEVDEIVSRLLNIKNLLG